MNVEELGKYGIDYQKGLKRCMNDESFYRSLVGMFLEDDSFRRGQSAYEKKDYLNLFKCMHELKGACGNADMTELFDNVCNLVELLRGGIYTEDEVKKLFDLVECAYNKTRQGVEIFVTEK